jgi:F420-non-reducing hydrogenase large subunit
VSSRITIDPITRLEGHGKIEIFLNDKGDVDDAYFQVPELRGFEQFCLGRRAEDMPQLTSRICGVCPVAHHYASTKALDMAFGVRPTPTALKLRHLLYSGYYIYDHILNFYFLAAPDFVVGPTAPKAKRNILGVIEKVGLDIAKEVIKHRAYGQKITEILGGKPTHPVSGIPGGQTRGINEAERKEIEEMARSCVAFAEFSLKIFADVVLANKDYMALVLNPALGLSLYNMGTVDENNHVNFYDGKIRVTDPKGKEFAKFEAKDYLSHVREHVVEWSYMKIPYLKNVGYNGLTDGEKSGIYRVGTLGRLNAADGMATPKANEHYKTMYSTFGAKPVNSTLAFHWARLIELLYAAENTLQLAQDPEITGTDIRNLDYKMQEQGIGVVEAARGTLFHHYWLTEDRLMKKINLIVATVNNAGAICQSIRNAAKALVHGGKADDGLLNMVEMFFRAYDPCFGCATHMLGRPSVTVSLRGPDGSLIRQLRSDA